MRCEYTELREKGSVVFASNQVMNQTPVLVKSSWAFVSAWGMGLGDLT